MTSSSSSAVQIQASACMCCTCTLGQPFTHIMPSFSLCRDWTSVQFMPPDAKVQAAAQMRSRASLSSNELWNKSSRGTRMARASRKGDSNRQLHLTQESTHSGPASHPPITRVAKENSLTVALMRSFPRRPTGTYNFFALHKGFQLKTQMLFRYHLPSSSFVDFMPYGVVITAAIPAVSWQNLWLHRRLDLSQVHCRYGKLTAQFLHFRLHVCISLYMDNGTSSIR